MRRTAGILAATAFLAAPALALSPAPAGATCSDSWNASEAAFWCTATVETVIASSDSSSSPGDCVVRASCRITVAVDNEGVRYTPSLSSTTLSPADTESLDVCFAADSSETSGFTATVKIGCAAGETTSSNAITGGLSTDS